jgi:hypothetical protein
MFLNVTDSTVAIVTLLICRRCGKFLSRFIIFDTTSAALDQRANSHPDQIYTRESGVTVDFGVPTMGDKIKKCILRSGKKSKEEEFNLGPI